jgi:hypothetical protein
MVNIMSALIMRSHGCLTWSHVIYCQTLNGPRGIDCCQCASIIAAWPAARRHHTNISGAAALSVVFLVTFIPAHCHNACGNQQLLREAEVKDVEPQG